MLKKLIFFFVIIQLVLSCSKKDIVENDSLKNPFTVYKEAYRLMKNNEFLASAKKFCEAENLFNEINYSAKSALMCSYNYYIINFYPEAKENLKRYMQRYPVDENIIYANYLNILISYETILDEKKDIAPLNETKEKIESFLEKYPNNEYAIDLKFKLDLINNQLAAKELYIAKFYINQQKWTPAVKRLQNIVEFYNTTIFIEEAMHRLVEVYYKLGLIEESKKVANILGYNYNSGEWYAETYKIYNKQYNVKKLQREKDKKKFVSKILDKIK